MPRYPGLSRARARKRRIAKNKEARRAGFDKRGGEAVLFSVGVARLRCFVVLGLPPVFAAFAGCAAVPDITFVPEDASSDVGAGPVGEGGIRSPPIQVLDATTPLDATVADASPPYDATTTPPVDSGSQPADAGAPPYDAGEDIDATCGTYAWPCCGPLQCRGPASACAAECTNCGNNCRGKGACCIDQHNNYQGCAATPAACPPP